MSCDVVEAMYNGWRMRIRLILKTLHHFTYVTAHSPTPPPLYLRHSSFYSPSVASPTSQALHLRRSSFSNPSAASSMPQLTLQPFRLFTYAKVIVQPFHCFTYVTGTSRTSPGEPPMDSGMKKQSVMDQLVTTSFQVQKQLQFWIVVKNFTTSSKLIFLQSYSVQ